MKTKRIQLIHRINNEKSIRIWQNIDSTKMITLKHVWNDIKQQLHFSNTKFQFSSYKTKQILPDWYHIDLLNDNDQILIENVSFDKSTIIEKICLKNISKKKQLKTYITNRSFIINNKYLIPNIFYQQWEEGKMHRNTNNCQMIF